MHRHVKVSTYLLLLLAVAPPAAPALARSVLRGRLAELLGPALADSAAVARRVSDPRIRQVAGDQACYVIVACARAVGRDLDADWVVMAKVSKTSNLIWLLTGQLINVDTGEIVLDDSTELKGDPEPMIRAGVRIFAERVARTVNERRAARPSAHSWRSASTGSILAARLAG